MEISNFAPRELLSITQAKFLCKRLFRVLLKSFLDYMRLPLLTYASHFAVFSAIPPRLTEARVPGGFG